jgi:hypothetical protein
MQHIHMLSFFVCSKAQTCLNGSYPMYVEIMA